MLTREWASFSSVGVEVITVEANWNLFGKSAGPRRNIEM